MKQIGSFLTSHVSGDSSPLIVGGDFNTHISELDKSTFSCTRPFSQCESAKELLAVANKFELEDLWRSCKGEERGYTRYQPTPPVFSRIDYFFTPKDLRQFFSEIRIKQAPFSDHSILLFEFAILGTKSTFRSPYWKFNASLLADEVYVSKIKNILSSFEKDEESFSSPSARWDFLLSMLRGETISYATHLKKCNEEKNKDLLAEISLLSTILFELPDRYPGYDVTKGLERLAFCRAEVMRIEQARAEAAMIRARIRWAESGEKSTRYFFQLEKQRSKDTLIECIEVDGSIISEQHLIRQEVGSFYEQLFSSRRSNLPVNEADFQKFLGNPLLPRLTEEQKQMLEGPLSDTELKAAVFSFSANKAPGLNGFSTDFFKKFWEELFPFFRQLVDHSFEVGSLSLDQRRSCIRLIPKPVPEVDKNKFKSARRPIALLACDYKIISKALARRLTKVLPMLIDSEQLAYLKGRFICEHIRSLSDLISAYKTAKTDGYIVLYDFEKAFDSIEWDFLERLLIEMNFPQSFINAIQILNFDISSAIIVNDTLTKFFPIKRGCRQGDPISAYLFLLAMQSFASYYKVEMTVTALALGSSKLPLLQFADDTATTHQNSRSVRQAIEIFRSFEAPSGLKLNINKTMIILLGNADPSELYDLGCKIKTGAFKYLGAFLNCVDAEEEYRLNFKKRAENYDALLNRWKLRGLSLIGKNLIVKSLCLSQITYPLQFILPTNKLLQSYKRSTELFIWGSRPKVKRVLTSAPICQGGLSIIDIELYIRSIRLAWLGRYLLDSESLGWRNYFTSILAPYGGPLLLACNFDIKYFPPNFPAYYKAVLKDYFLLPRSAGHIITSSDVAKQILWNNREILIDKKPFFFRRWVESGVFYVGQLFSEEGRLFSWLEFSAKFRIPTSEWLRFQQVMTALPKQWKATIKEQPSPILVLAEFFAAPPKPTVFRIKTKDFILIEGTKSKIFYRLLSELQYQSPTSQAAWQRDLGLQEILPFFRLAQRLKLQPQQLSFQWKLLHRLIPTGRYLFIRKIISSDLCQWCNEASDTILHYFCTCAEVCEFWSQFDVRLSNCDYPIDITEEVALLGSLELPMPVNVLLSWARFYIYCSKQKLTNPCFPVFLGVARNYYVVLSALARKKGDTKMFDNQWRPFLSFFVIND
jgi:hypothetical protein